MSNSADSDDDYMSSKYLTELSSSLTTRPKTYSELRRQKLSSKSGYTKPLREREKESREQGLSKRIDEEDNAESPGLRLLKKMGYEKGKPLGKDSSGITEPISIEMKSDKSGLGLSTELKHKAETELAKKVKRAKISEESFIERVRQEHVEKKTNARLNKAQRVCENLDTRKGIMDNVFWFSKEDEEIDEEPSEFEKLSSEEKFDCVLKYIREKYNYCFWCGCEYSDVKELEQLCPGINEDDHD
ncbi:2044_t:CDS:2 [Dentiscutata erythropus]|uniref:2044_t:CDS:1 n=1 Tax=Dentiscutata erythropus TaxID=1348616 RepID=A0A9N9DGE0_9GLOM|nr:2044_t:CDS:2 [Dentiscutata erythropus]